MKTEPRLVGTFFAGLAPDDVDELPAELLDEAGSDGNGVAAPVVADIVDRPGDASGVGNGRHVGHLALLSGWIDGSNPPLV